MSENSKESLLSINLRRQNMNLGREKEVADFRQNLELNSDDPRRMPIFDVYGRNGFGKTWLLKCFKQAAKDGKALTAWSDERDEHLSAAIDRIAEQFEKQSLDVKDVRKTYNRYQERLRQLEGLEDKPQGFSAVTILAKLGCLMASAAMTASFLPGGQLGAQLTMEASEPLGKLIDWMVTKAENEDERRLFRQPQTVLSEKLLQSLDKGIRYFWFFRRKITNVVLLFDSYERTATHLDDWLLNLLEGRYGNFPNDRIILVIGDCNRLQKNWRDRFSNLIRDVHLLRLTDEAARAYLSDNGLDPSVVETILRLSEGCPALLNILTDLASCTPSGKLPEDAELADTFLSNVPEHKKNQVLAVSIPRFFDIGVLSALFRREEALSLFDFLKSEPYVNETGDHCAYYAAARAPMLSKYLRDIGFNGCFEAHGKLREYYEGCIKKRTPLELDEHTQLDKIWQDLEIEATYHRLCQSGPGQLNTTINKFITALDVDFDFALRLAEIILQAGIDTKIDVVENRGKELRNGLVAYKEKRYDDAIAVFETLVTQPSIDEKNKCVAKRWRGVVYRLIRQYEDALNDFNSILGENRSDCRTLIDRGLTYQWNCKYKEALDDFDEALRLCPDDKKTVQKVRIGRGITYLRKGDYQKALFDFNDVLNKRDFFLSGDERSSALASRGEAYKLMGDFKRALEDFNEAIIHNPNDACALAGRAAVNKQFERYDDALRDYDRALELNPNDAWALAGRGQTHQKMRHYDKAGQDLKRTLEQNPRDNWALGSLAWIQCLLGEYRTAIDNYTIIIGDNRYPDDELPITGMGVTYQRMGCYSDALTAFERAINIAIKKNKEHWQAYAGCGITHRCMKQYELSENFFSKTINLTRSEDEGKEKAFYDRAITYREWGKIPESQADLNEAIRLAQSRHDQKPKDCEIIANLALYHLASGNFKEAESLYNDAVSQSSQGYDFLSAVYDLEAFLTLHPGHPQAMNILGRLRPLLPKVEQDAANFLKFVPKH